MNAMGRLNASTEIIPLQGPSGRNDIRFRQNFRPKPKPFFTDNLIVPRVKQYLEDHKDTVHVDMDAMVDELQRKYKDYARRKRNPFKQAVDKAFKAVLHQYGVTSAEYGDDQENSESSDDMYSEDIALESSNNSSATAGQIMNMYMNRPGVSTTSDMRRVHNRGNLQMGRYHHAQNNAHHSARSILMPRAAVKREVEWHQSGVALPRRGESTGDKELINISSDEEDAGVGLEEGTSISIAKIPPKGQQGLLPTPTGILPSSSLPSTSAANGRGADSTATAVNQSVEAPRPKCVAATAVTAGLAGRGGSEQSPMRPWPAGPPTASSTPRQAKRPRIGPGPKVANNPAATPAAAASSTTPTPASTAGSAIQTAAGGRDSPTPKRRRDAATLATAASVSAARLSAAGPPLDVELEEAGVTFADLGGIDEALEEVGRLLAHLRRPEVFRALGVPPPRGILLHGPPGCGKSLLARAVAGELRLPLLRVAGPELVGGVSGESEARVRELFERAAACAPCVLLLDEVDALAPPRAGAQREMERRIVAQLLACLDDLSRPVPSAVGEVLVLGATSRPEALDPALRRAGRFDREVCLGIPDARARASILAVLCRGMKLESNVDLQVLAKSTPGFVGADLQALTREAALAAVSRVLDEEQKNNSEETKDKEKPASLEGERKKEDENAKDEEKPSMSKEKENVKEEETKENSCEKLEVIDISERDTPNESETNKAPAAKADSSVAKEDTADEDEVCIEAEVSSSDAAKDKANGKVASSPETGDDMEVVEELDEDEVVPVAELAPLKSALSNVWNTQFPTLTDEQLKNICVTQDDFSSALKHVQPSAKREGFATVPDTSWDDVGALRDVREELQMAILAPIRHPEAFESLGLTAPAGLLLCGPPGCGKTLIAKAIANEADINFISVKGPELLNMYVGESEKAVRQCFLRARNSAPCVIFFDELDALCPRRTGGPAGEGNSATQRVVNQLLTEMDGVEGRRGVFLLAASNRPDILDPAVLRPGRLDRIVFVGLPGPDARADILRALTKNGTRPPLAADVDLQILGESAELDGCSGADLAALVREAATLALRQHFTSMPEPSSINQKSSPLSVSREHLSQAVLRLRPSVSKEERERYEILRWKFSAPQGHSHSNKESPHSSTSSSTSSQAAEAARTTITLNETQTENKQIESSPTPAAIPEPATSDEPTKSD